LSQTPLRDSTLKLIARFALSLAAVQSTSKEKFSRKSEYDSFVALRRCKKGFSLMKTHGMSYSPEYRVYQQAKYRCTNSQSTQWADYGGRGIKFMFTSFEQFITHIGPRPSLHHLLDRIDNDGHYEVGNVRWTVPTISSVNRRKRKSTMSKYRGLYFDKERNQWMARLGDKTYLGRFPTAVAAAQAYDAAAIQAYGKHAKLNFPQ
jgi:hypothetical protein